MNKIGYCYDILKITDTRFFNNTLKIRFGICVFEDFLTWRLITYEESSGVDQNSLMIDCNKIKIFKLL